MSPICENYERKKESGHIAEKESCRTYARVVKETKESCRTDERFDISHMDERVVEETEDIFNTATQ